jgi:sugar lactone lactonase YvrE
MKITRLEPFRFKLGEGPLWDTEEQALYGADVLGRTLWRFDPVRADLQTWAFDRYVTAIALRKDGGAVLALKEGLYLFDFKSGEKRIVAELCRAEDKVQLNDGKADPAGRFFVGSVCTAADAAPAQLYRLDSDMRVTSLDTDFIVTNGPCWSPDGAVFYFADTVKREIYAYDYDLASGRVANRRVFADTNALGGMPDGATVDAEGCLWTALCGGGKVVRYRPDGTIAMVIDFPAPLVSSVMFGGANLDRLFVTTIDPAAAAAEIEMADNTSPSDENSGALFVVDGLGVVGLPEPRFAG